ncbi:MAG: N-acyl-D-amino-acid deacylase family protein, partial [Lacisediminihabitans sp.]
GSSLDWSWRSVAEFLANFDKRTAVNVAYLLPHGSIRMAVMGASGASASAGQLHEMQEMVRRGLEDGAVGLSTGLTYAPAQFSDLPELTALCMPVAQAGGFFSPHIRSYGADVLASYEEVLAAATNSGVALHLTHCQMSFPGNEGRARELRELIDSQFSELNVTYDSYCYEAGSTFLAAFLPGWAWEDGAAGVLARLRDDTSAERIRYELEEVGTVGFHGMPIDWSAIQVGSVEGAEDQHLVGMRISEIAQAQGLTHFEAARRLLLRQELAVNVLTFVGHDDNIREIMTWPGHMAGSDGIMVGDRPHPRAWGNFARYLGHYARDEGMFTWPEIIRKMTSLPATLLRQWDRGLVRPGMWADLVVFDPQSVRDEATYEEPTRFPVGIEQVLVNGELVKHDGEPTRLTPGRVLRLPGASP